MEHLSKEYHDIRPYSEDNFARFNTDLFSKEYRHNLNTNALKVLFGLACSIDPKKTESFPLWRVPIKDLFAYLNLKESNGDRYKIARQSLERIMKSPLEHIVSDTKYEYISWFSRVVYGKDESECVYVQFDEDVKEYLLGLKRFCLLQPKFFKRLGLDYSLWLYTLLRNKANMSEATLTLTLDEIRFLSYNDKKKSYDPTKNASATKDILKNIIGIKKYPDDSFGPITDKNGNPTGAIHEINTKTDIKVRCEVKKEGRAYHHVIFYIELDPTTEQGKRKLVKEIRDAHFEDQDMKVQMLKLIAQGELFTSNIPFVAMSEVKSIAEQIGDPLEKVMKRNGYIQIGDRAYKTK